MSEPRPKERTAVIVTPAPSTKTQRVPIWLLAIMLLAVVISGSTLWRVWPSEPPEGMGDATTHILAEGCLKIGDVKRPAGCEMVRSVDELKEGHASLLLHFPTEVGSKLSWIRVHEKDLLIVRVPEEELKNMITYTLDSGTEGCIGVTGDSNFSCVVATH